MYNRFFQGLTPFSLFTILFFLSFLVTPIHAQSVRVGGFVKAEYIHDTRQVAQIREGQYHLFPVADQQGTDQDNLLFAAFQSRLYVQGTGAEALGAQVTGHVEADFFGSSNANLSTFRLRHAFVRLVWEKHELMAGQYWSPLFNAALYPNVINFNTGAPFQPFARFPQLRYTYKPGAAHLIVALSQQRDAFSDIGGPKMQQQASIPAAHLHLQYVQGDQLFGAGAYVKSIRPTLTSDTFTAWTVQSYLRFKQGDFTLRAKATYGNDLTDHLMTGGFVETVTGKYKPLGLVSGWVELESAANENVSLGLFGGYLANLGGCEETIVMTATRAHDMEHLIRVAPRVVYSTGPVRFAVEIEVTSALYATTFDSNLRPQAVSSDDPVTNIRSHLAAYYFF